MMLDKGQISGWDGEPEDAQPPKTKPAAKPVASAAPPGETRIDAQPATRPAAMVSEPTIPPRGFGEALPTGERVKLTPQEETARKRRGQWIAIALFAFAILLFTLTMTKIGGRIVNWGGAFTPEMGAPIEPERGN